MLPHTIKLFGSKYITKELKDYLYKNRTMPHNKLLQLVQKDFAVPYLNSTYSPKNLDDAIVIDNEKVLVYQIGIVKKGDTKFFMYYPYTKHDEHTLVKQFRLEVEANKVLLYIPLNNHLDEIARVAKANSEYKEFLDYMLNSSKSLELLINKIIASELERLAPIVQKQRKNEKLRQGGH